MSALRRRAAIGLLSAALAALLAGVYVLLGGGQLLRARGPSGDAVGESGDHSAPSRRVEEAGRAEDGGRSGGGGSARAGASDHAAADSPAAPALPASSDPATVASFARETCRDSSHGSTTSCYEGILVPLVASGGVEAAMETLRRLGTEDQSVQRDGHVYAHAIGIEAYRRDPDVGRTFGRCSELYQSGCYHGVIQAYFQDVVAGGGPRSLSAEDVNRLCSSYRGAGRSTWLLFQCVHGMGHGLTMFRGHDLPQALSDCDLLSDDWDRHSCYGGAFMENIVNATQPHHGAHAQAGGGHAAHGAAESATAAGGAPYAPGGFKPLDPADPLYPCSILEERYLVDCYQMQTSAILWHNHGNIADAARTCDRAPESMRPWCYQSLGRDISSYTLQDPKESIRMCSLGSPAWQPWCYVGLVKNFVDLTAKTDTGFAFCRRVPGRANKLKCYEALGEEISVLTTETGRRAELCGQSEEEFEDACRYGARLSGQRPEGLPWAESAD
jgi:hypothetical protein